MPPHRSDPPQVRDSAWVRNPIDAFILARLDPQQVRPALPATRETLLRRLSLDLRGLPPSPAEVESFLDDLWPWPDAYERWVDHLLGSPQFGEQWARHWLDLARYADSDGYEKDSVRPYAYLYREWVIDAINRDLPFDQFSIEQLAGDLLPNASLAQKIATGFHRNTLVNKEGGVDQEEFRAKANVDRVDTTGLVWLGLTLGCAECHNHKYDPISQHEFYQFYAFFNSTRDTDLALNDSEKAPKAQTLSQDPSPRPTYVHIRGDFLRPGAPVTPGTPAVLQPFKTRSDNPDRLDLARWLFEPENPLTARVAVNHIWSLLFGRGLVGTPGDFGTRGETPTHPELLDWLALEFQQVGWSRKQLIRLIVTSSTYRQSSAFRPELASSDPSNLWLARQSRFRLHAENIRDSALFVSGLLSLKVGGPSVRPPLPADIAALGYANSVKWTESAGADKFRRGLYTLLQRTVPYPMLVIFDAPDSNTSCTRRERSNTPLQALTLLNDPVFFECAQALGARASSTPVPHGCPECAPSVSCIEHTLANLFQACLGRFPNPSELDRLQSLFNQQRSLLAAAPNNTAAICGSHSPSSETAALILTARVLMNLEEFITRE